MTTITLEPQLTAEILKLTGDDSQEAESFVNRVLWKQLANVRRDKLVQEQIHFERQHSQLLLQFEGEYIAMHNGQVIDHDKNLRDLHLRVAEQHGRTPILLKQVTESMDMHLIDRPKRLID